MIEDLAKIEWIKKYQFSLPNYQRFKEVCECALDLVHEEGYFSNIGERFCSKVEHLSISTEDHRFINFKDKIKAILQNEGEKIPCGAHFLGSSEILESLFGKFKYIEDNHASSGLSSLVLAIPALVGILDEFTVKEALENISVSYVNQWVNENMGQTFISQRRQALSKPFKDECEIDLELCDSNKKNKIKLTPCAPRSAY